jgi:type I restriction enzyme S subunit
MKYKLGDVGKIVTGKTPSTKTASFFGGDYPFITPRDIQQSKFVEKTERYLTESGVKEVKSCILPKGSICVSCIGNLGYVAITTHEGVTNQQINSIVVDETISDRDYIYYVIKNLWSYFKNLEKSSTVVSILNKTLFSNIEIDLPSLHIQREVAATLSALDAKIENNTKINNHLEQMAQAIFKSWFVDFEPFADSGFIESELGEIPTGWRIGILGECVDFSNGYAFKSKELLDFEQPDTYHVFKMGHIKKGGGLNAEGTKSWIKRDNCRSLGKFVLQCGDLLMCMTDMKGNVALLGHTALMIESDKYIVNQRVGLLRANGYLGIDYPFLYILTNYKDFIENLRGRANSGVQVNLSTAEIKASKLVIAPEEVNERFDAIVKPLFQSIKVNQLENTRLATLRDTLLPRLMSGELSVADVDGTPKAASPTTTCVSPERLSTCETPVGDAAHGVPPTDRAHSTDCGHDVEDAALGAPPTDQNATAIQCVPPALPKPAPVK